MKIVLAGPPKSGKSCLREGLKTALSKLDGVPYPYVITACPDGEGAWFQATCRRSYSEARKLKERYKSSIMSGSGTLFSSGFVKRVADSVKNCPLDLVLIDIGGIVSKENREICAGADSAIVISGDEGKIPEWINFFDEIGVNVIAILHSDYFGSEDKVLNCDTSSSFVGVVHHLERGEDVSDRECIVALAQYIKKKLTYEKQIKSKKKKEDLYETCI